MNAEHLLTHFDRLTDAPDAIPRLRRFILDLAVRGKLVEQDPNDEPASELLKRIAKDFSRQVAEGKLNKPKPVKPLSAKEGLFSLPRGWAVARFNQVAAIQSNLVDPKRYKALPHIAPDNIESWTSRLLPYVSVGEAGVHSGKHLFSAGAILYSKIRPNLAKVAKVSFDGLCSADMYPIHALIDCDFLVKFMITESFVAQAVKEDNRVAMPKINQSALSDIVVPVPPLAEQHRIVAKVDELMVLCDRLETARKERETTRDRLATASLAHLNAPDPDPAVFQNHTAFTLNNLTPLTTRPDQIKALRQTILNLAVRGKLVEQNPNDEPAGELLKRIAAEKKRLVEAGEIRQLRALSSTDESPFDIPPSWEWRALGEIVHLENGDRSKNYPSGSDIKTVGVPFFNTKNVSDYAVKFDQLDFITEEKFKSLRSGKIKDLDILITLRGSVGKLGLFQATKKFTTGFINAQLLIVRNFERSLVHFCLTFMKSQVFLNQIFARSSGSATPQLSASQLAEVLIPLPPLAEQYRIVAKVDELIMVCDRLEASLAGGEETRGRLVEAVLWGALEADGNCEELTD